MVAAAPRWALLVGPQSTRSAPRRLRRRRARLEGVAGAAAALSATWTERDAGRPRLQTCGRRPRTFGFSAPDAALQCWRSGLAGKAGARTGPFTRRSLSQSPVQLAHRRRWHWRPRPRHALGAAHLGLRCHARQGAREEEVWRVRLTEPKPRLRHPSEARSPVDRGARRGRARGLGTRSRPRSGRTLRAAALHSQLVPASRER